MHRKMINPFGGNGNEGGAERCGINASVVALNRKRLGVGRGWVIHGSDRGDLDCSGRGGADPFADAAAGAAFFVDFDFASIIDAQRLVTDGMVEAGLTYAGAAAYDGAIQATSGMVAVTGLPETPVRAGFMSVDVPQNH